MTNAGGLEQASVDLPFDFLGGHPPIGGQRRLRDIGFRMRPKFDDLIAYVHTAHQTPISSSVVAKFFKIAFATLQFASIASEPRA